jgi:hypothetical protein
MTSPLVRTVKSRESRLRRSVRPQAGYGRFTHGAQDGKVRAEREALHLPTDRLVTWVGRRANIDQADVEAVRPDPGGGSLEIPVRFKVHDSLFVPLAKWPMLIAGNYRCIRRDELIDFE